MKWMNKIFLRLGVHWSSHSINSSLGHQLEDWEENEKSEKEKEVKKNMKREPSLIPCWAHPSCVWRQSQACLSGSSAAETARANSQDPPWRERFLQRERKKKERIKVQRSFQRISNKTIGQNFKNQRSPRGSREVVTEIFELEVKVERRRRRGSRKSSFLR